MINTIFLLSPEEFPKLYDAASLARVQRRARIVGDPTDCGDWCRRRDELAAADVVFSGWGAPLMDEEFLTAAPRLKAVFYAAGSVRYFVTDAFWQRKIVLTSAHMLNAIPVSEYTASVILLGLKRLWHFANRTRTTRSFQNSGAVSGAYRATVGLLSYGTIARLARQRLLTSDIDVIVHDPLLSAADAKREKVKLVSIEELFATADAVSVHTPVLPGTSGLVTGPLLASLKPGAIFINTARGEIVRESEMIAVLRERPDLQAVLDVTDPEPPIATSPLFDLPNVVLTPHIAGSLGNECRRMGDAMVAEFERYVDGQPLHWELTATKVAMMA